MDGLSQATEHVLCNVVFGNAVMRPPAFFGTLTQKGRCGALRDFAARAVIEQGTCAEIQIMTKTQYAHIFVDNLFP